jgi:hypothetical protein
LGARGVARNNDSALIKDLADRKLKDGEELSCEIEN